MSEEDEQQKRPTLINMGDAKVKNFNIKDVTIVGDVDFIKGRTPEIDNANISRITHINDIDSTDKAQLIHCLNVALRKSPELSKDIDTLQKALKSDEIDLSIIDTAKNTLGKFAVKSGDKLLEKLLNMVFGE